MTSGGVSNGIATRATWPMTSNQGVANIIGTGMESRESTHSSQGFRSQQWKENEEMRQALLGKSLDESPMEDLNRIVVWVKACYESSSQCQIYFHQCYLAM